MLSTRTGNAVQCRQLADTIGGQQRADTVLAGVPVSGVGRVELVARAHEAEILRLLDLLEEAEVEISRHPQNLADAECLQTANDEFANSRNSHQSSSSPCCFAA